MSDTIDNKSSLAEKLGPIQNPEQFMNNEILQGLAKRAALQEFIANDKPLQDATLTMLAGAQGLKGLAAYGTPAGIWLNRIANTVKEKSPRSLIGTPKLEHLKNFTKDAKARDKVLWTATGNGMKYGQTSQMVQ